jgi:hypothetical protein
LDKVIFKEDFFRTGIGETIEVAVVGMTEHPRITENDCAIFPYKNTAGRDVSMRLIDCL